MTLAPEKLGARLKAERERRGLTLEQISASTKITVPLLDALERDDLSRWPKGLYRRAFFRAYVTALGLRPEPLTSEFERMFPDGSPAAPNRPEPRRAVAEEGIPEASTPPKKASAPLALTLARPPRAKYRIRRHAVVALIELAIILGVGAAAAWATQTTVLAASGTLALLYYPLVNAVAGRVRRPWKVARAEGAAERLADNLTPAPARRAAVRARVSRAGQALAATGRSAVSLVAAAASAVRAHVFGRWLPALARTAAGAARALASAAGGTIRFVGRLARSTNRVGARMLRWVALLFWRVVGALSEQAYLLASRQMNRTKQ